MWNPYERERYELQRGEPGQRDPHEFSAEMPSLTSDDVEFVFDDRDDDDSEPDEI